MSGDDIKRELDALGRPVLDWTTPERLARTSSAIATWEAEHPEQAVEYRRLFAELERAEAEALAAYKAERLRPRMPSRTGDAAANARDTDAMRHVRRWLESGRQWLLLLGPVGTGKSVAAYWAVESMRQTGRTGTLCRAIDMARLSTWDDAGDLDALERVHLLVVDDYGAEATNDHARAVFAGLFDARHERGLRTILTSNLDKEAVKRRLGERIEDRIRQSVTVALVAGESMRSTQ